MSRPNSVVNFGWLYLVSIVISLIATALGWSQMQALMDQNPALAQNPEMAPVLMVTVIATIVIMLGITLLLWWLTAYKAANAARWILVVLNALGVASLLFGLLTPSPVHGSISEIVKIVSWVVAIVAIVFLFRADANAWFNAKGTPDTDPFGDRG